MGRRKSGSATVSNLDRMFRGRPKHAALKSNHERRLLRGGQAARQSGPLGDGRRTAGRPGADSGRAGPDSGVQPSTASEHLSALVEGGLANVVAQGRHRYFALAGPAVARALEGLARICPPTPVRSLRASTEARSLRFARTCYDHLAGRLGVATLDAYLDLDWLTPQSGGYLVSRAGECELTGLGIDLAALRRQRRSFARPCLDWTERRPHLAGALGAALTTSYLDRGWLAPQSRRRGLRLTAAGEVGLGELLGPEAAIPLEVAIPDVETAEMDLQPPAA